MPYEARILADSISGPTGIRLTTFAVSFPRMVLAEWNTHRLHSRNAASSRAIPVETMITRLMDDPVVPVYWGKNQKGMAAERELLADEQAEATGEWLLARDLAVAQSRKLLAIGVHKQISNRLLEPWMSAVGIVSATDFRNFFAQRCHPAAQPEIQKVAYMMRDAYLSSRPKVLMPGEWHLPFLQPDEDWMPAEMAKKVCVARCARVSYMTHEGKRSIEADLELYHRLLESGHMSPFEHVARCLPTAAPSGNFTGFEQLRKTIPDECKTSFPMPEDAFWEEAATEGKVDPQLDLPFDSLAEIDQVVRPK